MFGAAGRTRLATVVRKPRVGASSLALITTLTVVACGGEPKLAIPETAAPPQATTVATAVPPAPPQATPEIAAVVWTTATEPATNEPVDEVAQYATDAPALIAAARVTDLPAGTTVEATWTYNNTPLDAFASSLTIESALPERWLRFHLERGADTTWPPGSYAISISLGSTPVLEASIDVVEAP